MTKKKWRILGELKLTHKIFQSKSQAALINREILKHLFKNRKLKSKKQIQEFLQPPDPYALTAHAVGINPLQFKKARERIKKAIFEKESIVVYTDYDADGITAGAIMWETLHHLGARVMPYVPHRVEEGHGLSKKGIDAARKQFSPTLIITVDHGITAGEKIEYAKRLGIDVIVTDHHVKPKKLPECLIVHTTQLAGAGVSWFVAKEIACGEALDEARKGELLALAAIGTIADLVPLIGPNRVIAKQGLEALKMTKRVGLTALIEETGLDKSNISTYEISFILAPRLNAMGRLVHGLDALRLLCTKDKQRAYDLAKKLGLTNRERQEVTEMQALHAIDVIKSRINKQEVKKLLFVADESYNQGVIGLVAGKLVQEYYRPAIVVSKGEKVSKASARSINGFNIIEAIRSAEDLLVDVGGHPMAAGFTIETSRIDAFQKRLEDLAEKQVSQDLLIRELTIDFELPLSFVTEELWQAIRQFAPFGTNNPEPLFVAKNIQILDARLVGAEGKHLKLKIQNPPRPELGTKAKSKIKIDGIGFGMGESYSKLKVGQFVDTAYTIDLNTWNGNKKLQLRLKDIHIQ